VVAQITKTGQTVGISPRTLFTPQKDGLFRLSVYLVLSSNDNTSNSEVVFTVSFTDDVAPTQQGYSFGFPGAVGCNSGFQGQPPCSWSTVLRAKAGTPIMWQTFICPICAPTYDVFATLEKLQPLQ
jgi:hypothetical protein